MVPFLVLLWATACVAVDGHTCKTGAPQDSAASAAGSDEEDAALLQLSSDKAQHKWAPLEPSPMCCGLSSHTCCAYCSNDKAHKDKRECLTSGPKKGDTRPVCESCGGAYWGANTPGGCW
eukprot:CAMPEP_0113820532 /NCGR_PEP_ID=MMETSP0328-20130328/1288_1 /TAXON_ID=39455 /ORGANISM="Alexandrium minutum" /LENGTH=119 /DNA_ID=CAMNT_0000788469 /DNA_START=103 /DNA_END=459 /DNA_ORIENTATION=+ /assembly_acc=CAM_ASM_000350